MFTDELPNWQSVELLRNSFELSQQAMNSSKLQLPGLGVMEPWTRLDVLRCWGIPVPAFSYDSASFRGTKRGGDQLASPQVSLGIPVAQTNARFLESMKKLAG